MKVSVHQEMFKFLMGLAIILFAVSCTEIEEFDPQSMDADQIAKAYNFNGPLVEPINWAMRGRPDAPGNGGNNGGNVECSEVAEEFDIDKFEFTSGRNNFEDGEFDFEWPEELEVKIIDGTFVEWSFTAPDGYCLENLAVIVKGGPSANVTVYDSGITSDDGLASPDNPNGNPASLSNLTFCWNLVKEPDAPELLEGGEGCFGDEEDEFTSLDANDFVKVPEGVEVVWYDAATGGNVVDDPTLNEIGEVTYWAEAVAFEGCVSSERTPVTLILKDCGDGNGNGDDWCGEEETGYAGSSEGEGDAWWYYFDTGGDNTQPIYAGQEFTDGTITWDPVTDKFTIDLGTDLRLQDVEESVKAEGYDIIPTSRPASGQFKLYKGKELEFFGNGSRYYVIHLDLEVRIECKE